MAEPVEITFDRETLDAFKRATKLANQMQVSEFFFRGKTFNLVFAEYLIDYLDPVMEILERTPFIYPSKRVD